MVFGFDVLIELSKPECRDLFISASSLAFFSTNFHTSAIGILFLTGFLVGPSILLTASLALVFGKW